MAWPKRGGHRTPRARIRHRPVRRTAGRSRETRATRRGGEGAGWSRRLGEGVRQHEVSDLDKQGDSSGDREVPVRRLRLSSHRHACKRNEEADNIQICCYFDAAPDEQPRHPEQGVNANDPEQKARALEDRADAHPHRQEDEQDEYERHPVVPTQALNGAPYSVPSPLDTAAARRGSAALVGGGRSRRRHAGRNRPNPRGRAGC